MKNAQIRWICRGEAHGFVCVSLDASCVNVRARVLVRAGTSERSICAMCIPLDQDMCPAEMRISDQSQRLFVCMLPLLDVDCVLKISAQKKLSQAPASAPALALAAAPAVATAASQASSDESLSQPFELISFVFGPHRSRYMSRLLSLRKPAIAHFLRSVPRLLPASAASIEFVECWIKKAPATSPDTESLCVWRFRSRFFLPNNSASRKDTRSFPPRFALFDAQGNKLSAPISVMETSDVEDIRITTISFTLPLLLTHVVVQAEMSSALLGEDPIVQKAVFTVLPAYANWKMDQARSAISSCYHDASYPLWLARHRASLLQLECERAQGVGYALAAAASAPAKAPAGSAARAEAPAALSAPARATLSLDNPHDSAPAKALFTLILPVFEARIEDACARLVVSLESIARQTVRGSYVVICDTRGVFAHDSAHTRLISVASQLGIDEHVLAYRDVSAAAAFAPSSQTEKAECASFLQVARSFVHTPYMLVMSEGEVLEPDMLWQMACAMAHADAHVHAEQADVSVDTHTPAQDAALAPQLPWLLYADEDQIVANRYSKPLFKSDFSLIDLEGAPYIGSSYALRTSVFDAVAPLTSFRAFLPPYIQEDEYKQLATDASALRAQWEAELYDLSLRIADFAFDFCDDDSASRIPSSEVSNALVHIPHVLHHMRVFAASSAEDSYASRLNDAQDTRAHDAHAKDLTPVAPATPAAPAARVNSGHTLKPSYHLAADWGLIALNQHLQRAHISARPEHMPFDRTYRLRYEIPSKLGASAIDAAPLVSIIIPTKDHVDLLSACVHSIFEKTDYPNFELVLVENGSSDPHTFEYYKDLEDTHDTVHVCYYQRKEGEGFNYSALVNFGAQKAQGSIYVFLNNDTVVISPMWLSELTGMLSRKEIGIVGAKLIYPDGLIQHAGMFANANGDFSHINQNMSADARGYMNSLMLPRAYSMVTGALHALRRSVFEELSGYDETLAVGFNDGDICLRARELGYYVVYNPFVELYHHEFSSRGREITNPSLRQRYLEEKAYMQRKHARFFAKGDPFINRAFDSFNNYFKLRD